MEGILKVTPDLLSAKAGEFESSRSQIMTMISDMQSKVAAMKSSWEGTAADSFQSKFAMLNDDIEYLNSIIIEHVKDLNDLAAQYAQLDPSIESVVSALPTDIVK